MRSLEYMRLHPGWLRSGICLAAAVVVCALGLCLRLVTSAAADGSERAAARETELGHSSDLPLPSTLPLSAYEEKLFDFLNRREYTQLGWRKDKSVRDTGPYLNGRYYGTHPAVRVYYSPGVMRWLMDGRVGKIADGEMIIKEQFAPPAARHEGQNEAELWDALESWTVMVKDSSGSRDGWFWSNPAKGQCRGQQEGYPFPYPDSGFGLYCVRCHASAQSRAGEPAAESNEFTFASLRNVAGFPGEPIRYRVDDSWRPDPKKREAVDSALAKRDDSHPHCTRQDSAPLPVHRADERFLSLFPSIKAASQDDIVSLPPVTHDWVVSRRKGGSQFLTSSQCMNCHAGLLAPFGPSMFVPAGSSVDYGAAGWDVSPYGEWRWTPMGLAGRDPVFYAQLESEVNLLKKELGLDQTRCTTLCDTLIDACLRCHGAMGKAQFAADHANGAEKFSLAHVNATDATTAQRNHNATYGALAREGVSCMVCHRMQPRQQPPGDKRSSLKFFLETSLTGNFQLGPPGEINGPFKDNEITPYPMEHALGLKPKHSDFIQSSQLCGSCHAVVLPAVGKRAEAGATYGADELRRSESVPLFREFHHHVEQATYLEWLNSDFENEVYKQNPRGKSCQDCHMSPGLKDEAQGIDVPKIRTRIAAVQDTTYPEGENLAPQDRLNVRMRDQGYRRHDFSGLNVFLLELFNQFDDVLGVRKTDFMTGSKAGVDQAVAHFLQTAREDVATLDVSAASRQSHEVTAHVTVTNKVGHRFPSGVGFRRAFLELLVVEKGPGGAERIVWSSGRTNELGMLLGADGQPLPSESYGRDAKTGKPLCQKHHQVITSPDEVQVYEAIRCDTKGRVTTSFIFGCEPLKDNRLLPRGWRPQGPGANIGEQFVAATRPDPETARDPHYADGSGTDEVTYRIELPDGVNPQALEVRATLFYQALPPYFLRSLFETAPDGPATRRLHYLCSHVDLSGTPVKDWKLPIVSATCRVK